MKFRPQIQLRFRDEAHYLLIKQSALDAGISVNEFIVTTLEAAHGSGKAGGVESKTEVPRMRGGVQGGRKRERIGKVLGPSSDAPAESEAVGGGVQQDSGSEAKKYVGPKHASDCGCDACKLNRGRK